MATPKKAAAKKAAAKKGAAPKKAAAKKAASKAATKKAPSKKQIEENQKDLIENRQTEGAGLIKAGETGEDQTSDAEIVKAETFEALSVPNSQKGLNLHEQNPQMAAAILNNQAKQQRIAHAHKAEYDQKLGKKA